MLAHAHTIKITPALSRRRMQRAVERRIPHSHSLQPPWGFRLDSKVYWDEDQVLEQLAHYITLPTASYMLATIAGRGAGKTAILSAAASLHSRLNSKGEPLLGAHSNRVIPVTLNFSTGLGFSWEAPEKRYFSFGARGELLARIACMAMFNQTQLTWDVFQQSYAYIDWDDLKPQILLDAIVLRWQGDARLHDPLVFLILDPILAFNPENIVKHIMPVLHDLLHSRPQHFRALLTSLDYCAPLAVSAANPHALRSSVRWLTLPPLKLSVIADSIAQEQPGLDSARRVDLHHMLVHSGGNAGTVVKIYCRQVCTRSSPPHGAAIPLKSCWAELSGGWNQQPMSDESLRFLLNLSLLNALVRPHSSLDTLPLEAAQFGMLLPVHNAASPAASPHTPGFLIKLQPIFAFMICHNSCIPVLLRERCCSSEGVDSFPLYNLAFEVQRRFALLCLYPAYQSLPVSQWWPGAVVAFSARAGTASAMVDACNVHELQRLRVPLSVCRECLKVGSNHCPPSSPA